MDNLASNPQIDSAKPTEPGPTDPDGVVNTFKKGIWRRQYEPLLKESVEQQFATAVYGRLGGNQEEEGVSVDSPAAGISLDFPLVIQPLVADHVKTLERKAQEVGETTVLELQAEMAIGSSKVDDLRSNLADEKQIHQQLESGSVETAPANVESLQNNLETKAKLAAMLAEFRRLYVTAALFIAQITAVLTSEFVLMFLTLAPMFKGVAGTTRFMVATLAAVIAASLVYLGHGIWNKESTDRRWFSKGTLIALVVTLALVRAAGMSYGADGVSTNSSSDSITMWALVVMLALAGLTLAVLGGHASHRLVEVSKDAKTLRKQEGDNLAKWQAELDAQRSHDTQLSAQRARQHREIPRVERRIRKLDLAIRQEIAKTQRMVQRRIKKNTRTRLSGAVKAMARQLAAWRLRPPQTPNGRRNVHMTRATTNGILLCVILQMGCATPSNTSSHHLIDNSGSIARHVVQDTRESVLQMARDWVKTAMPGDEFFIWWLTKEGHPFPAEHHSVTMPPLSVPAYAARERFTKEALAIVDSLFDAIPPRVQRSPLIEAICFASLAQNDDSYYRLTVVSDFSQDSQGWNTRIRNTDEESINVMLDLCPPVRVPPSEILLVAWPGVAARGQDAVQQHRKNIDLFREFFRRWSPDAIVKIRSL